MTSNKHNNNINHFGQTSRQQRISSFAPVGQACNANDEVDLLNGTGEEKVGFYYADFVVSLFR